MKFVNFLGIDGCRSGWTAVIGPSPAKARVLVLNDLTEIDPRDSIVAIDMPIGLPERDPRACESAARKLLPVGRKSSVFPVPRRVLLKHASYEAANSDSKRRFDSGLPKQSWHLFPKLSEADAWAKAHKQRNIYEGHPELAFHRLSDGKLLAPKRTREGADQRRALLQHAGFKSLEQWEAALHAREAKRDDLFDACVLLLTARRIAKKQALRVSDQVEHDAHGLRMEIWY